VIHSLTSRSSSTPSTFFIPQPSFMRLFVAIDLPDTVRSACETYAEHLNGAFTDTETQVRWTDPAQYHMTLRFIGECSEAESETYIEALKAEVSRQSQPVHLQAYGLGVLPTRLSPRVLMVGLEQTRSLAKTYQKVSTVLENEGLDEADTSFRPHITLARMTDADPEEVHHILRDIEPVAVPNVEVSTLTLFQSKQIDDGTTYEPLHEFVLADA